MSDGIRCKFCFRTSSELFFHGTCYTCLSSLIIEEERRGKTSITPAAPSPPPATPTPDLSNLTPEQQSIIGLAECVKEITRVLQGAKISTTTAARLDVVYMKATIAKDRLK